jgi:hypothetical protein
VFLVSCELNVYILFRRNYVFKELIIRTVDTQTYDTFLFKLPFLLRCRTLNVYFLQL